VNTLGNQKPWNGLGNGDEEGAKKSYNSLILCEKEGILCHVAPLRVTIESRERDGIQEAGQVYELC
ncbi:MAG: hypothetical protein JSW12_07830, partial [Deltaproteobacteria bacterium]